MCGIFGYIGEKNAISETIAGIEKLEYRGYDSAGIAYIDREQKVKIKKKAGKVSVLKESLNLKEKSNLAIAHTRWATHGAPTGKNAHPHYSGNFVIVHNGIIENYKKLKEELINEKDVNFYSDTDTEVVAKLLDYYFKKEYKKSDNCEKINKIILNSIKKTSEKLIGSWAVALINKKMPEKIYIFKNGSPLTVAYDGKCSVISSDINAIDYKVKKNEKYFILNDDNIAELSNKDIIFYDKNINKIEIKEIKFNNKKYITEKCFEHYMLKEISEIPNSILQTKEEFKSKIKIKFFKEFLKFENITIIGCGTAYHAGLYGKYLFEKLFNKKINVDLSSEFRYKTPIFSENDLIIAISQSGETADTIAGVKIAKEYGTTTAVITNVQSSTITNICDYVLLTAAGPEVAVAATKSYIAQLYALYQIASYVGQGSGDNDYMKLIDDAEDLINLCRDVEMFAKFLDKKRFFFIGRLCDSNTALEGSLKLKEIAYVHSEGYPAGELKHGTLSLVDEETLVIAIITQQNIKEKTLNAVHETKARGAKTLIISQFEDLKSEGDMILLPKANEELMPILSVIPLQLFAYHLSISKSLNPDKPRNLAKSVTVE